MKLFNHRQIALNILRALGIGLGWLLLWGTLGFLAGKGTEFLLWPLGIVAGALLQKGMLEHRLKAVDRQLLTHPGLNDWVGDWFLCRPFLARLTTERARLLAGKEALQELAKEEKDWRRILGGKFLVPTGFQRLVLLDHQSKWADRLRARGRLPRLTPLDLGVGVLSFVTLFAFLVTTNTFVELFLFWIVPYFVVTPYWETRLMREFSEERVQRVAHWRRA